MAEQTTTTSNRPGEASNPVDQISALLMGDDKPEVKQETKPAVPKSKPKDTSKELPPTDESTEDDEEEQEDETDGEKEDDGESEESVEEDSDEEVTWAKVLGVDEKQVVLDDKGDFAGVNVKVDGKVSTIPLPDLIAGYQSNKSNTNKSKAIAEERKQLDTVKQQVIQEYSKKIQDAESLTKYLEESAIKDFQGIDWNSLRYQNPAEYAALVADYNLRTEEIGKIKGAIDTVKNEEGSKMNQEVQQRTQQFVQEQVAKVIDNNPQWADKKALKKGLEEIQTFIDERYGFSKEEFAAIQDARIIEVLKDAQKYHQGKTVATKKLEKKVPKFQKPTGNQGKTLSKLDKLTKAAKESKGYGQRQAQTDAVAELLFQKGITG